MSYVFDWKVVWANFGFLLGGVQMTLVVTVAALAAGTALGLLIALARMSRHKLLRSAAIGYIEVFRNTPALIQLMWVYYCMPIIFGIDLGATASVTIALAVNGAAYIAEIIRSGIQAIDKGQVEAARTLGMSAWQAMREVILPQALRRVIPPFVNESVSILKFSSLVSVLGVADLTYQAQVLATTTFRPIEIFTFIAAVYLVLCTALAYAARQLELRLAVID